MDEVNALVQRHTAFRRPVRTIMRARVFSVTGCRLDSTFGSINSFVDGIALCDIGGEISNQSYIPNGVSPASE